MDAHYRERFARSIGIMSEEQLAEIKDTGIAIGGLGMGGSIFINLVRMGFERFHIADPDVYERTNINRQRLAKESTIQRRKDESLLAEAIDINPDIQVTMFPEGVQPDNVDRFLEGMDWAVDIIDVYAMEAKLVLNERAHELGIPVVSSAAPGFGCVLMVFTSETPSLGQLSGMSADNSQDDNFERFIRTLVDGVPDYMAEQLARAQAGEGHIPFVVPGVEVAGALVTAEITKHILDIGDRPVAPTGIHCEPVTLSLRTFQAATLSRP